MRQGCPLSPYLFVVAINELSISLQHHLQNSRLIGISLGQGCPPIHSLLFEDDLIICGKANLQEAQTIHTALYDFCEQSGIQEENATNPIHFRSWEDICQSRQNGGLGIRDLHLVNKSLIMHTAYTLATNKNPFLTEVIKAKCYPNSSF